MCEGRGEGQVGGLSAYHTGKTPAATGCSWVGDLGVLVGVSRCLPFSCSDMEVLLPMPGSLILADYLALSPSFVSWQPTCSMLMFL